MAQNRSEVVRKSRVAKAKERFKNIPVNFSYRQVESLDDLVSQRKMTRSEIIREAVKFYLEHLDMAQEDLRQSELAREVARIEKRLSSLMIKMLRVSGQNLYWSTLQWVDGPPKGRLNQEGFNHHWQKSGAFSGALLKATKSTQGPSIEDIAEAQTAQQQE